MLLIITNSQDHQTDEILSEFQSDPIHYFRLNTDYLAEEYALTIYPSISDFIIQHKPSKQEIRLKDISVYWYTGIRSINANSDYSETELAYLDIELNQTLLGVLQILEFHNINEINNHFNCTKASTKIGQQIYAKQIGFQLPEQIITSTSRELLSTNWHQNAIHKPVHSHKNMLNHDGEEVSVYTELLSEEILSGIADESIEIDIAYFQERIHQIAEYRVVFFDYKAFTYRMKGDYKVDYRRDLSKIETEYIPNHHIEDKCKELAKKLNLQFACIDLIEDKNELYFLECNSPAYFTYLDRATHSKRLSTAFVKYIRRLLRPSV